jgi:hypothetical protein
VEDPLHPESSKAKLTGPGCVVTLLSVVVIFTLALPIVRWRDPDTGEPLPRFIAIFTPLIAGACFNAAASFVLRLFGISVWAKPVTDHSFTTKDTQALPHGIDDEESDIGRFF